MHDTMTAWDIPSVSAPLVLYPLARSSTVNSDVNSSPTQPHGSPGSVVTRSRSSAAGRSGVVPTAHAYVDSMQHPRTRLQNNIVKPKPVPEGFIQYGCMSVAEPLDL